MPIAPRRVAAVFALAAACYLLFFYSLTGVGMLGPDEPRYASIGREMARSGDWVTPRLGGQPWFEKPPLLYWMTAAAFSAGVSEDLAPRLGVALLAVGFLFFYWRTLRREFGEAPALYSTAILATCAAWLVFGHVGVTDLPVSAAFSAAMLLSLGWVERGERRALVPAAALLGVAVLAKGLLPLALALPLVWMGRARLRDLLRPGPILAFLAIAVPWYAVVTARYGNRFVDEFFWKQHLARFTGGALPHPQPFWFYGPILVAALFPWSPLLALLVRKSLYRDRRRKFLLLWLVFGMVFLSAAANKLPGYLMPLLPAAAALAGLELAESAWAPALLTACALLLGLIPTVAAGLPDALAMGVTHAWTGLVGWGAAAGIVLAAGVWLMARAGQRKLAVAALAAATLGGAVWIEAQTFPVLDRTVSARGTWRQIETRSSEVCVAEVNRGWLYGLNYYSVAPLPDCRTSPRPIAVGQVLPPVQGQAKLPAPRVPL
ncbi:MAG: glycosyltransferase family 39 protein [Bryobacteraceae bacterium]